MLIIYIVYSLRLSVCVDPSDAAYPTMLWCFSCNIVEVLTHTVLYDAWRRWKNETGMNIKMITGFNLNQGVFSGEFAWVLWVSGFPQQCDWEFQYSVVWHWIARQVAPCFFKALFSHEVLGSTTSNTAPHARRQNPSLN